MIRRLVVGWMVIATVLIAGVAMAWISESRLVAVTLEGMLTDYAAEQRFLALDASWKLISAAPYVGHGTGYAYTMDVGPHNMVLRMWIENGMLAVGAYAFLYCAIIYLALNRRDWWIGTTGVAALVMGMVSHNLLEDRTLLISFGIFLAMSSIKSALPIHPKRITLSANSLSGESVFARKKSGLSPRRHSDLV
jgi:O-antigen ligase